MEKVLSKKTEELQNLQKTVKILGNVLQHKKLSNNESQALLQVIADYAHALDILDHYPDGDIFLIPVRIDDCEIPDMIKRVHFTDLFPSYEVGFKKMLLSLTQN